MIVDPWKPPAVQAVGVVVEKVTARCEEAVALTVKGDWAMVLLVRPPNAIVWLSFARVEIALDAADGAPDPTAFRAVTVHV